MVKEHLRQSARDIDRDKVTGIFEDAKLSVDTIGFIMSKNEVGYINKSLKTKAIPTPKILIKYHKKLTRNGDFPTRLVIPATNSSATFVKMGYLGLKNMLEKNEVNYTRFTIF